MISLKKDRFVLLLIALLLFFIIRPVFLSLSFSGWMLDAFMVVVLLSCVNAIKEKKRPFLCALGLLVVDSVFTVLKHANPSLGENVVFQVFHHTTALLFLLLTTVIIFTYIFRGSRVTRDRIAAAVCVYLLLGVLWAKAFSFIETVQPGSFQQNVTALSSQGFDFYYYSFVTLSTLGYGDITPITHVTRALAALEALIGPLYLAILIARLVGLHIAQKSESGNLD